MADDKPRSFWNTLPGVLSGLAALLTALTGIYVAVDRTRDRDVSAARAPIQPATEAASPEEPAAPGDLATEPVVLLDNGNAGVVSNGPVQPTSFTIDKPHRIDDIRTYHWNDRRGAPPRTIGLVDADGRRYGPWEASASPGDDGTPNVNWLVRPAATVPAGTYTIVDGDAATWSHNAVSGGAGFAFVRGRPAE